MSKEPLRARSLREVTPWQTLIASILRNSVRGGWESANATPALVGHAAN